MARKSHWKMAAVLVVLFLVGGSAVYYIGPQIPKQDILPGFEGETNGIWGYQVGQSPATTFGATPLPALPTRSGSCSYSWAGSPTITSVSVNVKTPQGLICVLTDSDTVLIGAQENPVITNNPYTTGQIVKYYVPVPGSPTCTKANSTAQVPCQVQLVDGQVEVYTFNLNIAVQAGSSGEWNFGGDGIWYNLLSEVWNYGTTDPSNSAITGPAFEAPLFAQVTNVQWSNQGHTELFSTSNPGGVAVPFYSSPNSAQTLAELANPTTQDVNNSLGSVYAPDTRLTRLVYYTVPITSLQANLGPLGAGSCNVPLAGCTYPSVQLTITLYTLRIGEYIVTNPSTVPLNPNPQACTGLLGCISQFLSNPLNQLIAAVGVSGLIIIVVVVLAIIFLGPEFIAALAFGGSRRR